MFNIPEQYSLVSKTDLSDIASVGYLLTHKKSGAKVSIIENDDDNKVFYIGFRTTPTDSTGVAHILEHSVLCGSKKYPLKDPFVELAKGSLNTFLNAMTYPDKTVYPIASQNDKDFANLMDVYMDAVLNPNIYENEKIFAQEGWHYEINKETGELSVNGVVYNEMKGAFSTPDDVLEREILNSLFPDNTYAYESGGDPKDIPSLTYEDFLAFHKRYYHPSNSYIYLYGDCDMEERLLYLDSEYLSKYDAYDPGTEITEQKAFKESKSLEREYPVPEGQDSNQATYYSKNYVIGDILDAQLNQAFTVLDYALLNSPGAPIREALMKKGIGKDIIGGYQAGTLQPYFTIGVKGASKKDEQRFHKEIDAVLKSIVENGIDKKSLLAAINIQEFTFREADFGSFPKGLLYGLMCLDSWLYSDNEPFLYLFTIPVLNELKEKVDTPYFTDLVKKYFINNPHNANITLRPKEGLSAITDKETAAKLSKCKDKLSKKEVDAIVDFDDALKEFQLTPTSPEDLRKLPLLKRSDLKREVKKIKNRVENIGNIPCVFHDINTNGIVYLSMYYDLLGIAKKDIPALSFAIRMLGLLDTQNYSYAKLSNEINVKTGGIYISLQAMSPRQDELKFYCVANAKFLEEHYEDAVDLSLETMIRSKFEDSGRIRELLNQEIQNFKVRLTSSGHTLSAIRAMASFSEVACLNEYLSGIEYYKFLLDLDSHYEDRIGEFKNYCKELISKVFSKNNLTLSITGDKKLTKKIEPFVSVIESGLFDTRLGAKESFGTIQPDNEGIKTAAAIQYVARAGSFTKEGHEYNGALKVLKTILSYEYLWNKVRVSGGAYGCMVNFKRNGDMYFVSYRDPNLSATNEVFDKTSEFVENFDCDDRDMTKYVIGTVSNLDTPLTPQQEGERSMNCLIHGYTQDMLMAERNEVLDADTGSIRALAGHIKDAMNENRLCVIGSESAIEADRELFATVETLS